MEGGSRKKKREHLQICFHITSFRVENIQGLSVGTWLGLQQPPDLFLIFISTVQNLCLTTSGRHTAFTFHHVFLLLLSQQMSYRQPRPSSHITVGNT